MANSQIGAELEADLRQSPEKYTEDLHKEMKSLHQRIEKEMGIEQDAVQKDEELLQSLERMLNLYSRYESDLITFVTFLEEQPDDADNMTMAMRFKEQVDEGDLRLNNNPTELPQVIRSIEEDFKEVFEKLKQKDEELKKVLQQDYALEDEIEIIEKMAEKLEELTSTFEANTNR